MDSQALKVARMTAGMRRHPGKTMAEYNQSSAAMLRADLGLQPLNWKSRLVKQQGGLVGHCLRQPLQHPEHAVLLWRSWTWSRFNALLPPYRREMQHSQGPAHSVQHWWAARMNQELAVLAQDRDAWRRE
eukprot:2537920-Amphidinium_carterae.1